MTSTCPATLLCKYMYVRVLGQIHNQEVVLINNTSVANA